MFGRRCDGRKLRTIDPMTRITPYLFGKRDPSTNHIELNVETDKTYEFLSEHEEFSLFHIVIAAVVRTVSQRPAVNRFVSGYRLYARNEISVAFTIKRSMRDDGEETTVKLKFDPRATLPEIAAAVNKKVDELKEGGMDDDDKLMAALSHLPRFMMRGFVGLLKFLEYFELLPRAIVDLDPMHSTVFLANHGSISINGLSHHLYDWGTTSVFVAMSGVTNMPSANRDGSVERKKIMQLAVSCDDRVCDGFYWGKSGKMMRSLIENPKHLMTPPETVIEDIR